ncbi:hypothetical protein [Nannocystis bainbridge]|uniref:Uncharacterized protein n=1 Tax=Nannocystis bainbridge TaxID=2995303 RepID=A0ABT5DPK5_9BACT|nr:hypothetical protein [Nannocystis bainbridge]MDC0715589.1 hypothetical protein [Nannocystis bainbridge]
MRSITVTCLLFAATLACELKAVPEESATAPTSDATETSAGETETSGEPTGTATTTTTETTTTGSESSPSEASVTETGEETEQPPPLEPTPCEGEAVPLEVAKLARVVIPDEPECAVQTTSCWEGPEEGTLEVHLAGQAHACADTEQGLECGQWEVKIWIPPGHQSPGLHQLTGPEVRGVESVYGADQGDGVCDWSATMLDATLEIVSIDASGIEARLCHVNSPQLAAAGIDLAGSFSVSTCE